MKSRTLTCITAVTLFAALATPVRVSAQHNRYKPIDLGTLGGPSNDVNSSNSFERAQVLNNRGTVVGLADTSIRNTNPTPFFPSEFNAHAFQWQKDVLTDLGTLPGGNNSFALWISPNGLIAGFSENGLVDPLLGFLEINAVLWKDGEIINLGTKEGGYESGALSVNSRGQVVGAFFNSIPNPFEFGFQERAFLWQEGVMQDLGTLGGNNARADYINEQGQIAGHSDTNSTPNPTTGVPTQHPFLWQNGTMLDLGTLGGTVAFDTGLNNRGQVIGQSNLEGDLLSHPFLWDRGVLTDLGTLGGDSAGANWLNDAREVVGPSLTPGNQAVHSFLWKHGVKTDLGTVGDDLCSWPSSINSQGQIVGLSNNCESTLHAFLWEKDGPMIDLNTRISPNSGVKLVDAYFINDRGEIVAVGMLPNGDVHIFLLIPCSGSHRETAACEDGGESTADVMQNHSAYATQDSGSRSNPTPDEVVAAFRAELARRNRGFGARIAPFVNSIQAPVTDDSVGEPYDFIAAHEREEITTGFNSRSASPAATDTTTTHTLTGYCWGHVFHGAPQQCGIAPDLTQCPVGQNARTPTRVCGCLPPQCQLVDTSRACQARNSKGQLITGECLAK